MFVGNQSGSSACHSDALYFRRDEVHLLHGLASGRSGHHSCHGRSRSITLRRCEKNRRSHAAQHGPQEGCTQCCFRTPRRSRSTSGICGRYHNHAPRRPSGKTQGSLHCRHTRLHKRSCCCSLTGFLQGHNLFGVFLWHPTQTQLNTHSHQTR